MGAWVEGPCLGRVGEQGRHHLQVDQGEEAPREGPDKVALLGSSVFLTKCSLLSLGGISLA